MYQRNKDEPHTRGEQTDIFGDQALFKNGFKYHVMCKTDQEAGSNVLDVTYPNSRYSQINQTSKYVRQIYRFDLVCKNPHI